jgi:hypothetical protein
VVVAGQLLQVLALIAGCLLAGAADKNGWLYGAIAGVWNGILSATLQGAQGEAVTAVSLYGEPMLHTAFGAFGGLLGTWLWKPLPLLREVRQVQQPAPLTPPRRERPEVTFQGPVRWFRILLGCAIAVAGVVWTQTILAIVLVASGGQLSLRSDWQQRLTSLEVAGLAIFLGAAFAGANTWNGRAQGAWTGLITASALVGIRMGNHPAESVLNLALIVGGTLALSFLGGSFGSRLLPPMLTLPTRPLGASLA